MIILVTLINVFLLVMLGKITFTDEEEEFPPASERERTQLKVKGICISIDLEPKIYGHNHHAFLILAEKNNKQNFFQSSV